MNRTELVTWTCPKCGEDYDDLVTPLLEWEPGNNPSGRGDFIVLRWRCGYGITRDPLDREEN